MPMVTHEHKGRQRRDSTQARRWRRLAPDSVALAIASPRWLISCFTLRCLHPCSGMDADLQKKMAGKWDPNKAAAVRLWIEAVTKKSLPQDLHEALKSGVALCELVNAIWPGSVKKINQGAMPFVQRENIVAYLSASKGQGLRETDLFVTQGQQPAAVTAARVKVSRVRRCQIALRLIVCSFARSSFAAQTCSRATTWVKLSISCALWVSSRRTKATKVLSSSSQAAQCRSRLREPTSRRRLDRRWTSSLRTSRRPLRPHHLRRWLHDLRLRPLRLLLPRPPREALLSAVDGECR